MVIPFLGAGASIADRVRGSAWNPPDPDCLPNSKELALYLAKDSEYPAEITDGGDLAKIASYYADIGSRSELRRRLRHALIKEFSGNAVHRWLAGIEANLVMVVTNYDTRLEQAFRDRNRPFDVLIYRAEQEGFGETLLWQPHEADYPIEVAEPEEFLIEFDKRPLIFKMHGSIVRPRPLRPPPPEPPETWDTFVISEEDYIDFLGRMILKRAFPACLMAYFRSRSFLFLGYSLSDWNLRVILSKLNRYLPTTGSRRSTAMPSWAIQLNPTALDVCLWENRNVKIFGMDLNEFVEQVQQRSGN